jgi:glucan 1,3-beta-glucosidase
VFASTGVAVFTAGYTQVIFDNVETTGVTFAIQSNGGQVYYNPGNGVTQSYALGTVCFNITGVCETYNGALSPAPSKPQFLLDGSGSYFVRSKPQYQDLSASSFINVRNSGAVGNGVRSSLSLNSKLQLMKP